MLNRVKEAEQWYASVDKSVLFVDAADLQFTPTGGWSHRDIFIYPNI